MIGYHVYSLYSHLHTHTHTHTYTHHTHVRTMHAHTCAHTHTHQIPPLRLQRHWYKLDPSYLEKLAEELSKQTGHTIDFKQAEAATVSKKKPVNYTLPYSEYESRYGRYSDPLYSRHQPDKRPSGLDPNNPDYVYVDPHILATPVIADTNRDGVANELVVPVSYYFDPFHYGNPHNMAQLGGLEQGELVEFTAGGIVVIDLNTGQFLGQKVLGVVRASSSQPGYILSTPTVVKMFPVMGETVIIISSGTGELHMLSASDVSEVSGFPVLLDSIYSQVAVADLFKDGNLVLVVGDNSGNVYCIDGRGKRLWEREVHHTILSSLRFADFDNDGTLEVVLVTRFGDVWVLNGQTGSPFGNYPIHLSAPVESSITLVHLNSTSKKNALSIIIPTSSAIYVMDALTGCLDSDSSEHMFLAVQVDDIDPFNPGLELLAVGLDGHLVCFSTASSHPTDYEVAVESWPGEAIHQNGFTHKSNSFAMVLPQANYTARDISGGSFSLNFELYDNGARSAKQFHILVTIGRKYTLYNDTLPVYTKKNVYSLSIPAPPTPIHAFMTVKICNEHLQCDSVTYNVKFNLHFEDNLKWFLSLPFLSLSAMLLWLLRDAGFEPLPTSHTSRKNL